MDKNPEKNDIPKTQEEIDCELKFWKSALHKENLTLKNIADSLKALEEKLSAEKNPPSRKS